MKGRYLMDTDVCIHLLRGNGNVARKINEVGFPRCAISEITKAELLYGMETALMNGLAYDHTLLQEFLADIECVPLTGSIPLFAREKARLVAEGRRIEDFDIMIGCTAIDAGMVLVTANTRHMSRLAGITVENWAL